VDRDDRNAKDALERQREAIVTITLMREDAHKSPAV